MADLRNGGTSEADWTTNFTFCEGPRIVTVIGDPPSDANSVSWQITSTHTDSDASMTRNSGGEIRAFQVVT